MKFKFTFFALLLNIAVFAQTSDKGYSFQGFAIDPDGKALGSTPITVKFTVSPSTGTGGTYVESHTTLSTDAFGVFHAVVGGGTKDPAFDDFKTLDFTRIGTTYKLKVEVKKTSGGIFTTINEADFNAVPYARKAENGVPVGTIVAFAGAKNRIPEGWAICDGALMDGSNVQWKQLYNIIGNAWGGSGSNFNLPDLRGMFMRGVNDGRSDGYRDPDASGRSAQKTGGNSGDAVGSLQGDNFRSHGHSGSGNTNTDGTHKHTGMETARADNDDNDEPHNFITGDGANYYLGSLDIKANGSEHSHAFSFNTNNNGGNETRPQNVGVFYIIKY